MTQVIYISNHKQQKEKTTPMKLFFYKDKMLYFELDWKPCSGDVGPFSKLYTLKSAIF